MHQESWLSIYWFASFAAALNFDLHKTIVALKSLKVHNNKYSRSVIMCLMTQISGLLKEIWQYGMHESRLSTLFRCANIPDKNTATTQDMSFCVWWHRTANINLGHMKRNMAIWKAWISLHHPFSFTFLIKFVFLNALIVAQLARWAQTIIFKQKYQYWNRSTQFG